MAGSVPPAASGRVGQQPGQLGRPGQLLGDDAGAVAPQRLREGGVRQRLADDRHTAAGEGHRVRLRQELADQTGLADAELTRHDHRRRVTGGGTREGGAEGGERDLAS